MARIDGGDLVARTLKAEGIDAIFTLSGSHIQNIYDGCLDEGIRVIDTRHEQTAAHAADGWGRINRKPGVAVVTSGPGVTDAVTGVATAFQTGSPMVLIGGRAPLNTDGMGNLQEMEQVALLKPITKWAGTVYETKRIPDAITTAFRQAMSGRYGPVFLEIPSDVLFGWVEEDEVVMPEHYRVEQRVQADPIAGRQAAAALARAERPVIMAGSAIYWSEAWDALRDLAEAVQAPTYLNALGRGCLPPDHPLFFNRSRKAALAQADVILTLGAPLDFRLGYGRGFNPQATLIQADIDGSALGRNRGADIGLIGDARAILEQLRGALDARPRGMGAWLEGLRQQEEQAARAREPLLRSDAVPIHPLRLCAEIAQFVDEHTLVVGDGGDIVANAAGVLPISRPGQWFDPGPLGTLGAGPGFCLAASVSRPGQRVLQVMGDGSFGLNGFDLDTFVRFGFPVVTVVGNDRQWGQIVVNQRKMYGPERLVGTLLGPNVRYDRVVQAMGGHGEFVTEPDQIRPAIERAFASGKPACVDVVMDPNPPGVAGGYKFM